MFDDQGGFYFTDHGLTHEREAHVTGIYYGKADGSMVKEIVFPAHEPNGIGLSPDGTKLYWAETWTGRIMQRDIVGPGEVVETTIVDTSVCLYGFPGFQLLDSLAVDSAGNVCVATLVNGGVSVVSPQGELVDFVATGDLLTTNICFGGDDLHHRLHHALDHRPPGEDRPGRGPAPSSTTSTPDRALDRVGLSGPAGPHSVSLRSVGLSTLPPGLRGRGSARNVTYCGTLKSASCSRANAVSSGRRQLHARVRARRRRRPSRPSSRRARRPPRPRTPPGAAASAFSTSTQ